jgi:tetratricopeptide (TPR) repeat protein
MNELRILFAKNGDALTYRLVAADGGDAGAPREFKPFLSDEDYEDLRWYLEAYMELSIGGAKVRAERVQRSLVEWGRKLFDLVFGSGDHRVLYEALLKGEAPRLLTVGSKDPDLLRLPWELMADGAGALTRHGVTIRRQLESAGATVKYETGKLPLRILLAVSRPDDAGFLDPRHTTRAMLEALAPLGEGVVVDFCRPATLPRLNEMLDEAKEDGTPYHIVHFDGHGTFLKESQIGALCFEKDEDARGKVPTDLVRADQLGQILAAHRIPVAILEACRSGQVGDVMAFRGVAPALLEAGVGSVLAMSHAVHVEATRILLERFYEKLAAGASIGEALEKGRGALIAKPDRWLYRGPDAPTVALQDWFLPHLYQRGADPVLVPKGTKLSKVAKRKIEVRRAAASGEEAGAFPGRPMYGFFGRAPELHTVERRFLKHRAVLLHAMGGMGKTSLAREAAAWWTKPTGLFPDGACFVSFEQAGGARRAVQVIGAYFEGAAFERRPEEEQRRVAKELFLTKRVLVVWDNFESVLPAFQGGEGATLYGDEERADIYKLYASWMAEDKCAGRLLVTCRPGDTGLAGACKVELTGLAKPDALSMLYAVMQKAEVVAAYEREALEDLLRTVEMHPLSIELVGPHLKTMTPQRIVADFEKLLEGFKGEAAEARNRSLQASIGFSLGRLSKEAREAVRWLGLFRGGVFEQVLLAVSKMEPEVWAAARGELKATALVGVEQEVMLAGKPYLRFHPTLAVAAGDGVDEAGVRERYVEVYLAVRGAVNQAFHGSNPRGGMEVMVREEANFRTAVGWALEQGAYDRASGMGDTLGIYLQFAGRLRERDRWVAWLAGEVRKGGFSQAVAGRERDEARALLSQGHPREALDKLQSLIERLKSTTEFDAAFSLADMTDELGHFYLAVGWAQKAVPVLKDAVGQWEALVDKARAAGESGDAERGNLAATLGDLANALRSAGSLEEALAAEEQATAISRERGDYRSIAAGLARTAQILMHQGRHADADARYDEALQAAQRAGDRELEGALLQNQGILAQGRGQLDRAAGLYQRALQLFQDMHDDGSVMRTCNLLGVVEQKAGRLAEARAWYERSRELAVRRGDQQSVGAAAQNLGIVCQKEGEAARKQGDEARARERFTEAARFVGESLAIKLANQDEPGLAGSYGQLARIHLLLGDLTAAEHHAHQAREIRERLGLKEAFKDYNTLAGIAHARNLPAEAAAWEQKRDALRAELDRRAGAPVLPPQIIQALGQLALACAKAGLSSPPTSLGAAEEEALATIAAWPPPLSALAPFLRALAAGAVPALPADLPADLAAVLTQVLTLRRDARSP